MSWPTALLDQMLLLDKVGRMHGAGHYPHMDMCDPRFVPPDFSILFWSCNFPSGFIPDEFTHVTGDPE